MDRVPEHEPASPHEPAAGTAHGAAPQMLQSIEILQLATAELLTRIDEELQQNETLEVAPVAEAFAGSDTPPRPDWEESAGRSRWRVDPVGTTTARTASGRSWRTSPAPKSGRWSTTPACKWRGGLPKELRRGGDLVGREPR
ncbi:MAG: hypothetical protein IPK26_13660 [Planctomycetes bacterium]|nr:hypothetical protein [Planctomycetota bacterium]